MKKVTNSKRVRVIENIRPNSNLNHKLFQTNVELVPTRDGYGQGLLELGEKNSNVVALTADLTESTRVQKFAEAFPERFIECGVAEQNMVGIAAGLASEGLIPFLSSYAVFVPGRCWDQLRVSVCYSNLNVKVIGAHSGISVGPDGATHQGLEDIASIRAIPNLTIVVPSDYIEAKKATLEAVKFKGPLYLRLTREKTPVITTESTPFKIGRANVLQKGNAAAIIACGPLVYKALIAAYELQKEMGIEVTVVNNHTIKPIDKETIVAVAQQTGAVVTVEEHQVTGGLGGAVAEVLAQNYPVPMEFVGMKNTFGESGEPEELLEKYGMGVKDIKNAVRKVLKRKK